MIPRENPELLGHLAAERLMRNAAESGRLHHAWLITGAEGVGKATLAYRFGRALLAGFPEPDLSLAPGHPVFRRVAAGSHADLVTIARAYDDKKRALKNDIVVDDARALGAFLSLTAAEGGWRVVVVDGAEHLNRSAANAVLKLLEEPPPRTVLLLTASSPGRLLPTIRSRCRRLPLRNLDAGDVLSVLRRLAPELGDDMLTALVRLGNGAPGAALGWLGDGLASLGTAAERLVEQDDVPPGSGDALADLVLKIEGGPARFTDALRMAIGRHVRASVALTAGDPEAPGVDRGEIDRLCEAWSAVDGLDRQAARFNLDRRQAILGTIHSLRRP